MGLVLLKIWKGVSYVQFRWVFLQAGGEGSDDVMSVMRKILQRQTELEAVVQKQQQELDALRAKQQAGTSSWRHFDVMMGLQLSLNSFTFLRLLSHFDLVSHNTQNSSVVNDRKVAFTAEREVAMAPLWKKLLSEKANANPLALLFFYKHSRVFF